MAQGPIARQRSCSWGGVGRGRPRCAHARSRHAWKPGGVPSSLPPATGGPARRARGWKRRFTGVSAPWGGVGAWPRRPARASGARAVDQSGAPRDVFLTDHRDTEAAGRLLTPARRRHGVPETIPREGRDAQEAAITRDNEAQGTARAIGPVPSLHNIVAQDPRAGKRVTRPLLGCQAVEAAPCP